MGNKNRICIIGCGILGPEIKYLSDKLNIELELTLLPSRLHNTPELLRAKLQEAINEQSEKNHFSRIVIAYGLCGKGSVGIEAGRVPLVFPKTHDCIALFLGGDKIYQQQFADYPGTYYITEGWSIEKEKNAKKREKTVWIGSQSLGFSELEKKFGKTNGKTVADFFNSWTQNYQRAAYIDTGVGKRERSLRHAQEMASEYGWKFEKIKGNLSLLEKLLQCKITDSEVLIVPPGHRTIYSSAENGIASAPVTGGDLVNENASRQIFFGEAENSNSVKPVARYGLGVDAGGTYTDGVIYDFFTQKIVDKHKSLTTKWDFSSGISNCLKGLDQKLLKKIEFVSVSTTLATNAIVEGDGQTVGLILMTDEGLHEKSLLSHQPRSYIKGSLNIRGGEKEAIDPDEVKRVAIKMRDQQNVSAFAVSGYAGSINPIHEQQVSEILRKETGLFVCCGHELSDQLNFITRAQTAVVNGRIIPRMIRFFNDLETVLQDSGLSVPVMVVKGDGSLITKSVALEKPVETILSGPAASAAGARQLTGLNNALVVDIGGTTTDSADIIDGEVAISKEGAVVGGIKTHVRALNMKTVGFGGDSHIFWNDGQFDISTKRVAPLVWAGDKAGPLFIEAIENIASRQLHHQQQQVLFALHGKDNFPLTDEEKNIYSILENTPLTTEQLAESLGILSPSLLPLGNLEDFGLVQRCGLTPTDIMHILNIFQRWSATPAEQMLKIFAQKTQTTAEELADKLMNLVISKLSLELINASVFADFPTLGLQDSAVYQHLVNDIINRDSVRYAMKIDFNHPIIGIGAPASCLLPPVSELLSAQIIVPENADVANALGAVTSHVFIRQALTIQPLSSGRYSVIGIAGTPSFAALKEAENWVVSHLCESIRATATMAGTSQNRVSININDRLIPLRDGSKQFLERKITGYLKGSPDLITC